MRKPGRPAKYGEAMKDYRVRLAEHHAETFRRAGQGNMSAGARTLAEKEEEEMNKGKAGMTLVELLVVVGICAVLAAIALGVYSRCREPAENESMREGCRQIYIAQLAEAPEKTPLVQEWMSGRIWFDIPRNERRYDPNDGGFNIAHWLMLRDMNLTHAQREAMRQGR